MLKKLLFAIILILDFPYLFAQDALDNCSQLVKQNMETLASDEYLGREATTEGGEMAATYITQKLQEYNIKPFGEDNSYYQYFDVNVSGLEKTSSMILLNGNDSLQTKLEFGKDFILLLIGANSADIQLGETEIVYVGYGITAPEYNYDDYEGLDVKGKAVLMTLGEPYSENDNFFNGKQTSQYENPFSKISNANSKGAAAMVLFCSPEVLMMWDMLISQAANKQVNLAGDISKNQSFDFPPIIILNQESTKNLLEGENLNYEKISEIKNKGEIPSSFTLNKKMELDVQSFTDNDKCKNILGIIEGNDPVLKNEYIVIGGHYDHVGVTNGQVYNGADDNASGTVAVMEIGRMLQESKSNKRSIIVALWDGEEKGLLGSTYFVNSVDYLNKITASVNHDMVGRGSSDTLYVLGSDRASTEFHELVNSVNDNTVKFYLNYFLNNPNNNFYNASDHAPFAQKKIPVVFFNDYMLSDLHKPSDDFDKINYEKICKTVQLTYQLALEIANRESKFVIDK
ncbi:MAG: M28 family peptidase [Ignavibacteriales bacterium]|nr:M28 family peptidase [Ignavibacteriales bacterium]